MRRRTFLQALAAAPAFAAPQPAVPVKLGFDTYSLRAFGWKLPQFLEYAARQKLDTFQISSMSDYESYEPAYLQKVKLHHMHSLYQSDLLTASLSALLLSPRQQDLYRYFHLHLSYQVHTCIRHAP